MLKTRFPFVLAVYALVLVVSLVSLRGEWKERELFDEAHKSVRLAADWEDVQFYGGRSVDNKISFLDQLRSVPVNIMAVTPDLLADEENIIRQKGFGVLWKLNDEMSWEVFSRRFQKGDGVVLADEKWPDRPFFPQALKELLEVRMGFAALIEFEPLSSSLSFFRSLPISLIYKTHVLGVRELKVKKEGVWHRRLLRAVRERGARILCIRISPVYSLDENIQFQKNVVHGLSDLDFFSASPAVIPKIREIKSMASPEMRLRLMFLVSLFIPLMAVFAAIKIKWKSPVVGFLSISFLTTFGGVFLYGLGSTPAFSMGLYPMRGVKLQLGLPIVMAILLLLTKSEKAALWNSSLKVKHLMGCVVLGVLALFFFSRSGNFPLFPVPSWEREIRDTMENVLGARPRWKEWLLGHPFFVLGLFIRSRHENMKSFFKDGRFFLLLGTIGQISITNTFLHIHTPIYYGLLRTFHGVWLGILVSWLWCVGYEQFLSLHSENRLLKT